jgi:hypothetical protein
MGVVNPVRKILESQSANPIIVGIDCTGSMSTWPAEIFDRLPLFCQTLAKYRPDVEVSFSVIGDAHSDNFPLQIAQFGRGPALDEVLKAFYPEGGGGGQGMESYELWAYFMDRQVKCPNAERPFLIFMGDESFYPTLDVEQIKAFTGLEAAEAVAAGGIWASLKKKFAVYLLHKPYGDEAEDAKILAQWVAALGAERIIQVPAKERVVDVALGLIARAWSHFEDFLDNMAARQDQDTIAKVVDVLDHVVPPNQSARHTSQGGQSGPRSKPLV